MPGFNPEKINIHDITVEEPEKELERFFDPEKDITPEQWEQIKEYFEVLRTSSFSFKEFKSMACDLTILGHRPDLTDDELHRISNVLTKDLFSPESIAMLAILKGREKISYVAGDAMKTEYDNSLVNARGEVAKNIVLAGGADLLPNGKAQLLENFKSIRNKKQRRTPHLISDSVRNTAVAIKLLGGGDVLTPEEWQKQKKILSANFNKNNLRKATEIAADLAILSADEVKIPKGGGLELINHKKADLQPEAPEMPEQRSF